MTEQLDSQAKFLTRLESLRGIAALCVAVYHSFLWLNLGAEHTIYATTVLSARGGQATAVRALLTVINGGVAVDIFFVLSGFVLTRSVNSRGLSVVEYCRFVFKRVLRIFPALIVSIALALFYIKVTSHTYYSFPFASDWYNEAYRQPITPGEIVANLTLQASSLNSNAWTLRIEMMASLLIPFIAVACRNTGAVGNLLLLAGSFALGYDKLQTGGWHYYLFLFVLGANAQCLPPAVTRAIAGPGRKVALCSAALLLFLPGLVTVMHLPYTDVPIGIGAAILILVLASDARPARKAVLDSQIARFLGRISYSLYLIHIIFLYALATLALRHLPAFWLAAQPALIMAVSAICSIGLSLPVATAIYILVERPAIRLAKAGIRDGSIKPRGMHRSGVRL